MTIFLEVVAIVSGVVGAAVVVVGAAVVVVVGWAVVVVVGLAVVVVVRRHRGVAAPAGTVRPTARHEALTTRATAARRRR